MLQPFDVARWQPSQVLQAGDEVPNEAELAVLGEQLSVLTKKIMSHPYDPCGWLQRCKTFRELRFPELAMGDAFKAHLLCGHHLERMRQRKGWKLGRHMAFWMMDDLPLDEEREKKLEEYLCVLQQRAYEAGRCTADFPDDEVGRFRRRPYPWIPLRWLRRSEELVDQINTELAERSIGARYGDELCVAKRNPFDEESPSRRDDDMLGVFSTCPIKAGQNFLLDETRVWGCNGPGEDEDGFLRSGMAGCDIPWHPNVFHAFQKRFDLRWIRDRLGHHAHAVLQNCRLLLCCVEDGVDHPLDHSLVARLTATYPRHRTSTLWLERDIAVVNEALQQFGIDIFANHNYDTWILFTIQARTTNNACGTPVVSAVSPLFSLFNHSCEPNAEWRLSHDHRSLRIKAIRDIDEGEQLLVMYDGFLSSQRVEERRRVLWRWLDGPCHCPRCVKEAATPTPPTTQAWDTTDDAVWADGVKAVVDPTAPLG